MRPVLLEMDGFCSYRTRTTVDFRDADFFALVGATGSGKSTVIDAMVFALYGTVPRWDNRSAVAPALAPTVNRGVVRLIFDAGGKRYVAVRDVRRGGGRTGAVTVREARLERLVSPEATGEADDEIVAMASGSPAVTGEIERLLGLNFEQFTQSVALPQGEFARFLHATDGERQAILKNLLGYNIYERIQSAARSRASDAESKAAALAEQLGNYTDATEQHVEDLTAELDALTRFADHVNAEALPEIKAALTDASAARQRGTQLSTERDQLLAVEKPDGLEELGSERRRLATEAADAEAAQSAVELQDNALREQLRTSTPRHELEQTLALWQELTQLDDRLPGLTTAASTAKSDLETATSRRSAADAAARAARETATTAETVAAEAQQALDTARHQLSLVAALEAPADIHDIAESTRLANEALAEANSALEKRETEHHEATEALGALPDPVRLAGAETEAGEVRRILDEDAAGAAERTAAADAAARALANAEAADDHVGACEDRLRAAEQANHAAALRADLHVGDNCPVCGHVVIESHSDTEESDVNAARITLQEAQQAAKDARSTATRAQDAQQTAAAVRVERLRQCDAHRAALVEHLSRLGSTATVRVLTEPVGMQPSSSQLQALADEVTSARDEIARWMQQRSAAEVRLRTAAQAVESARAAVQVSHGDIERARQSTNAAFTVLHQARDRVSALGPPALDDTDVAAAWARLTAWGEAHGATVSGQVDALTVRTNESQAARQTAREELERAETAVGHATDAYTAASIAAQQTADALDVAMARRDELAHALADRAPSTEIAAQLDVVKDLESRLAEVGRQLRDARAAAAEANRALIQADTAIEDSWRLLRRVRDPLTAYGAPEVDNTDLSGDWQRLLTWAATEAQERATAATAQLGIATVAEGRADTAAAALDEALAAHHIEIPGGLRVGELAERVPAAVASAVTATKGLLQRAEERLLESQTMRGDMANAQESAQVARTLSNLMHTQHFPRWLISSALDALLLDASNILLELSGGQFELTRDERDLLVIDHNDADMSRSVKTLSGGETFQASLALALALSEQVTALSAVGASKLESIFLDEGFGTLDETTLDVVAGTLENLASSGTRMVGVITHVAALAERIPVRFQVNRDTAGSHIERLQV